MVVIASGVAGLRVDSRIRGLGSAGRAGGVLCRWWVSPGRERLSQVGVRPTTNTAVDNISRCLCAMHGGSGRVGGYFSLCHGYGRRDEIMVSWLIGSDSERGAVILDAGSK